MPGACPSPERLATALRRREARGEDAELAAHLTECPACQSRIEMLAGGTGWWESKAKTHRAVGGVDCEALQQAISKLESRFSGAPGEASIPPTFDFLQLSEAPDSLGRFGPYEIVEHIASGGMGIVFKARDPALNRMVAIKVLPPALAANAIARARFIREARAAAAVVHDHVVPIYAVDEFRGIPYLVMQFVHGRSLSERLRAGGPLKLEEVLRIGAQAAAGLAAAHAQGLIHRDVKPGNILLENSVERVKLTDFGLARAADDIGLTRTGELAGTPEFMAPEQASNEPVDERSDLFSFGSVLYVMGTGCSPFQGSSVIAVVRKVCDEQPPPLHEINPAIPRWLSQIVARLMAKAPEKRFGSAKEVGHLLESYLARVQRGELGALPQMSPQAGTRWRPRQLPLALGGIVLLAFAVVLAGRLLTRPSASTTSAPKASSFTQPFVVRDQAGSALGGFVQIWDALNAAPAGGVVELCWTGPRDIPAVMLPNKSLTLRAGRGFEPSWISRDPSAPGLSASAPLVLEDIRFALDTRGSESPGAARPAGRRPLQPRLPSIPPSGLALIYVSNTTLHAKRCALDIRQGATNDMACVVLVNALNCRLESTLFFARMNKGVVWREGTSGATSGHESSRNEAALVLTNCIAFASEVIWLDLAKPSRARLEIDRSTFGGPTCLYFPPSLTVGELTVETQQTLFDTSRVIYDGRGAEAPALPQWIRWRQREDLFSPFRWYVVFPPPASDSGLATLGSWNQWWNQSDRTSRHVSVTFANGRSDAKPIGPLPFGDPLGFQITDLQVTEGPSLSPNQWSLFGADVANVGPAQPR